MQLHEASRFALIKGSEGTECQHRAIHCVAVVSTLVLAATDTAGTYET